MHDDTRDHRDNLTKAQPAFIACVSLVLACGGCGGSDSPSNTGGASATGSSTTSGTGDVGSTTDAPDSMETGASSTTTDDPADTSTSGDETGEESETGDATQCGDGIVQDPEQCDDANAVDGDGCESDCGFSPQALVWERFFDLGFMESAGDLALSPEGEVYVVGRSFDGESVRESIVWNLRSADGEVLWTESFTGDAALTASSVDAGDGLVAVGGSVESDGTRQESIRIYAPGGELQWSSVTPQPDLMTTYLALHPSADAVTASREFGTASSQVRRTGAQDGVVWSTGTSATATDIAVDEAGAVYVSGMAGGEGWVGKFDAAGELQWDRTWAGAGIETRVYSVAVGPDGDVRTTGPVIGDDDVDVAVQRWSSADGSMLMAEQVDIEGSVLAYRVDVGASGKTVVCGAHNPNGPGTEPLHAWLAEFDERGAMLWDRDLDAATCLRVKVDSDDFVVLAGSESSDVWVARVAP